MEKITNKKALEFVLSLEEVQENVEICEKLSKMLEQVEKKSAKSDKPTKAQEENVEIKKLIVETMSKIGKPCQIKELVVEIGYTNQKLSALVRQLVMEGVVERTEEKKVAFFKLV